MEIGGRRFSHVWVLDFEFSQDHGGVPAPICLVAHELVSGQVLRFWEDDLRRMDNSPLGDGPDVLHVAFFASAEVGCFLSLGWQVPTNILDLYVEFRNITNGLRRRPKSSLLGALAHFGVVSMSAVEKTEMRDLALRGGPWTGDEQLSLLDYCEADVLGTTKLLDKMVPRIDTGRALLRGRYMTAIARMESVGIPIDVGAHAVLRQHWLAIQDDLIEEADSGFGFYDGRRFKLDRFEMWLEEGSISWPRTPTGRPQLDTKTLRMMSKRHPQMAPIRDLRATLGRMRVEDLQIGGDGRNRCMLSPFASRTSRNQPSSSKYIFGPSSWVRGLIRPVEGFGIAYVDYSQQEFGVAAALSGDPAMIAAYESGDPYMAFAVMAGAAPPTATRATHGDIRNRFKECALAVLYGMGSAALAVRAGVSQSEARELLKLHKRTYPRFWSWLQGVLDVAYGHGKIWTALGWYLHTPDEPNDRSIGNFPMQATGAEILRAACILTTEAGIRVCGPVHDALLVEDRLDSLDETVARTQRLMGDASEYLLDGFRLRSDVAMTRYPERFMTSRGKDMWEMIWRIIRRHQEAAEAVR